jgi:hypothetical protein
LTKTGKVVVELSLKLFSGRCNMKTQDWSVGNIVKAGFLTLTVTEIRHTLEGTTYTLRSMKGQAFTFKPYMGLRKIKT